MLVTLLAYNVRLQNLYCVPQGDYPILYQSNSKYRVSGEGLLMMAFLKRYFTTALADHLQSAESGPEWQSAESFQSQDLDSNSLDSLQ